MYDGICTLSGINCLILQVFWLTVLLIFGLFSKNIKVVLKNKIIQQFPTLSLL